MTTAFYPITNGTTVPANGYFEIPGNFTPMFTPGFNFVAIDSGSGSPPASEFSDFVVACSEYDSGRTRIYPAVGSPVGSPLECGSPTPPGPTPNGQWVTLAGGAYALNFTDPAAGSILVDIAEVESSTSLRFPGRASLNYGELINENFLHLLENFAYDTGPVNPVIGQTWFDKGSNTLKVWTGAGSPGWVDVAVSSVLLALEDLTNVTDGSPTADNGDVLTFNSSKNMWEPQPPAAVGGSPIVDIDDGVNYDEIIISGSPPISSVVNTTNVTTTTNSGSPLSTSYIQVFRNGILQREGGNYNVTGANQITFTITLNDNDEILIYQL